MRLYSLERRSEAVLGFGSEHAADDEQDGLHAVSPLVVELVGL